MPPKKQPANRSRRVVKLADWKEKTREAGAIDIETEDGTIFTIDPPEMWNDIAIIKARIGDPVGTAEALLGDRYEAFVAAGGNAAIISAIIDEEHGEPPGK